VSRVPIAGTMCEMNDSHPTGDAQATSENDPRTAAVETAEMHDPHSGVSDDPRVDPTPDRRHTEKVRNVP
jgi:hypothetical protein